jgi:type IV pilus assembly protein PilB
LARFRIGEILVLAGAISEERLRAVLYRQRHSSAPLPLGRLLVAEGAISETVMIRALGSQLEIAVADLDAAEIDEQALDLLSSTYCEEHGVLPMRADAKRLDLAMTDPSWVQVIDEVQAETKLVVSPHLTGPAMLSRAIARCYGREHQETEGGKAGADELRLRSQNHELRGALDLSERKIHRLREVCAEHGLVLPDDL